MGIDLGTSSVKAVVADYRGNIMAVGQKSYGIEMPCEGYAEQHPETWWEAVKDVIKKVLSKFGVNAREINGIGLSGQMHGMVPIDMNKRVVRPAIIWCDQRSVLQVARIHERIGREQLGKLTLNPAATGFQLPSFLWMKQKEPENYGKTYKVILPKDYIRLKLTGQIGTDITDASSTLAFNTSKLEWSKEVIEETGLDMNKYPECRKPYDIAGQVTADAAKETGLAKDTPVVFGGGDQPIQAVGNGVIEPGTVSSTIGTGGQVFVPVKKPLYDRKLRTHTFCHAVPDTWSIMGASLCAGLSLKWLRDNILCGMDFGAMDKEAEKISPGSEGLVFLPYLTGERTPHMDPFARGVFFGLTLRHTRVHMVRAVMEGVVFALMDSLQILRELNVDINEIVASGGGAGSTLWLQIQADVFGYPVYTVKATEQACLGAAIMAAVGTGVYRTVEEACGNMVRRGERTVEPDSSNTCIYMELYDIYRDIYLKNKDVFKMLGGFDNEGQDSTFEG
jgi:xylulokinase